MTTDVTQTKGTGQSTSHPEEKAMASFMPSDDQILPWGTAERPETSPLPMSRRREDAARAIRRSLHYLQWDAHAAGLDFVATLIGVAALAAKDVEDDEGGCP